MTSVGVTVSAVVDSIDERKAQNAGHDVFSVLDGNLVGISKNIAGYLGDGCGEFSGLGSVNLKAVSKLVALDLVVIVSGNVQEGFLLSEANLVFLLAFGPQLAVTVDLEGGVQSHDLVLLDLGKDISILVLERVLDSPSEVGSLDLVEVISIQILDPQVVLKQVPSLDDIETGGHFGVLY